MESTDHDANTIDRREAIRRVGLLLGGALSAPTVAGVLSGCQPSASDDWTPSAFSAEQNEMVTSMAEHIIPATDTPGAKDARVNRFIDKMLAEWYGDEKRQQFLTGLGEVDTHCQERYGQPYLECTPENQFALLERLNRKAFNVGSSRQGETQTSDLEAAETDAGEPKKGGATRMDETAGNAPAKDTARAAPDSPKLAAAGAEFYRLLKELTLLGYYTSQVGMEQELQVNIVPGRYDGCMPLDEVRTNLA